MKSFNFGSQTNLHAKLFDELLQGIPNGDHPTPRIIGPQAVFHMVDKGKCSGSFVGIGTIVGRHPRKQLGRTFSVKCRTIELVQTLESTHKW